MGVDEFTQNEFATMSTTLQDGYLQARSWLKKQSHDEKPVPTQITRVVIYRTQLHNLFIYDYVFKYGENNCHEVLFSPATNEFSMGNHTTCHFEMNMNRTK